MAEMLQGTLDPRVTPRGVLRRHPNHQRAEVSLKFGTPAAGAHIRPLTGHQLAIPSKTGIGRDDGRDLSEQPTSKPMPQVGEAAALAVIQAQSSPFEPCLEDAVLFAQERNDVVLLMSKPTAQCRDHELERKHIRSLTSAARDRVLGQYGLDHVIVMNAAGLRRVITDYVAYYMRSRTHLALGKDTPLMRPVSPPSDGRIVVTPEVGGLHHRYDRIAASPFPRRRSQLQPGLNHPCVERFAVAVRCCGRSHSRRHRLPRTARIYVQVPGGHQPPALSSHRLFDSHRPMLAAQSFRHVAHESRPDWSMPLGSLFLLLVGAGPWSLDARLASRR
jgi:hypothetical protein